MHVRYFECAEFKFDIGFRKFWAQITNFGYSGPKSIKFLIFLPVSYFKGADFKFDIGFRKFWVQITKFGHFRPKTFNFLFFLFASYFEGADFVFESFRISNLFDQDKIFRLLILSTSQPTRRRRKYVVKTS